MHPTFLFKISSYLVPIIVVCIDCVIENNRIWVDDHLLLYGTKLQDPHNLYTTETKYHTVSSLKINAITLKQDTNLQLKAKSYVDS